MARRTPAGAALTALILEAFRLNGELLDAGNEITKPHGLTSARWQVMGAIDMAGRPLTVAQIARRMGLARQGVQRIVNDLVQLGMVVLQDNIDHQRAKLASLSRKGHKAIAQIDEAQVAWVNRLSDGLSEREIKRALRLMKTVAERCPQSLEESCKRKQA
ncbi:MAG: MarR family winged helix-turn-helix transcriptional regulator [Polyangiales bacterium]